jgi:hypothetical protein
MLMESGKVDGGFLDVSRSSYVAARRAKCLLETLIYEFKGDIGNSIMLQVFSPSLRVSAKDAKQDRITLRYSNWQAYTERENLNLFFEALGRSPAPQRAHEVQGEEELGTRHNVRVFRSVDRSLPFIGYIHVRGHYAPTTPLERDEEENFPATAEDQQGRVPLFLGRLCQRGTNNSRRLVFDELQLNVTRYAAYQLLGSGPVSTWPDPRLYANRRSLRTAEEFVLGLGESYADNILLSDEQLAFCRPRNWQHHIGRYWAAVRECLDYRIALASRIANVSIRNVCEYDLRKVETYWEFRAENPISLVYDLSSYLSSLGSEYSDRRYPAGYREVSRDRNAPVVKVLLQPGTFLRLYAKTNRMVRFEIVHDFSKGRLRLDSENQVERRASDPLRLRRWLNSCAEDAAEKLNEALAFVERSKRAEHRAPALGERPYNLLRIITAATSNEGLALALIEMLCENGIIEVQAGSPLRRPVLFLQERGVLERTRQNARSVRVAAEYRPAVQMIREGRVR